jgi:hypothetical protein
MSVSGPERMPRDIAFEMPMHQVQEFFENRLTTDRASVDQ